MLVLLGVAAIFVVLAGVSQLLSSSPTLTAAGLVMVGIGAVALQVWRAGKQKLRATTLADLLALTPTAFEHAVADLLHDLGYKDVRTSGGAGDLNVDIWCRDPDGKRVAVQCKRYALANRVGSPEVQTFIGMIFQHHGADLGMFVTTSSYTVHALRLASQHSIRPIDGDALAQMILDARSRAETKSKSRPLLLRAPIVALALPLGIAMLGAAATQALPPSTSPGSAVQTAQGASLVATVGPPSAVPTSGPTATVITASSAPAAHLVVGNTESQGVYLRRTPVLSDRMKAYADGTELQMIGPDVDAGGVHWRHVAAPDGAQGYVPTDYVLDVG